MNGIVETKHLKIRSEEPPVSFSKEWGDSSIADPSNFVRFLLQLYSVSNSGAWNPAEIQALKQDPVSQ